MFWVAVLLMVHVTSGVLITEIMYNPRLHSELEYFEIFNDAATTIDLSGWTIPGVLQNAAERFNNFSRELDDP